MSNLLAPCKSNTSHNNCNENTFPITNKPSWVIEVVQHFFFFFFKKVPYLFLPRRAKSYIEEHEGADPLIHGMDKKVNPWVEKVGRALGLV